MVQIGYPQEMSIFCGWYRVLGVRQHKGGDYFCVESMLCTCFFYNSPGRNDPRNTDEHEGQP